MNARKLVFIAGVGMSLGCGRLFDPGPAGNPPPPPPPPTGNPPGPVDSMMPPEPEDPDAKKSAVDGALEEAGQGGAE